MSKISFEDKVGVIPYGTRINQIQDRDINEIKKVVGDNYDEHVVSIESVETVLRQEIIDSIADSTIINNVTTSSAVPATGNIHAIGIGPGTYTNWGGKVIPVNNIGTLQRVEGVYSVSLTPIADVNKIKAWVAGTYISGDQVNHLGKDWVSNAAIVAGDIPGTSSKWAERLAAYGSAKIYNTATATTDIVEFSPIKNTIVNEAVNVIDISTLTWLNGSTVQSSGYVPLVGTNSMLSDFLEITPDLIGTELTTNSISAGVGVYANPQIIFYDSSQIGFAKGVFTSASPYNNFIKSTIIPVNTKYIRMCFAGSVNSSYYSQVVNLRLSKGNLQKQSDFFDYKELIFVKGYIKNNAGKNFPAFISSSGICSLLVKVDNNTDYSFFYAATAISGYVLSIETYEFPYFKDDITGVHAQSTVVNGSSINTGLANYLYVSVAGVLPADYDKIIASFRMLKGVVLNYPTTVNADSIFIKNTNVVLPVKETLSLSIQQKPSYANETILITSNNANVTINSDNTITGKTVGSSILTISPLSDILKAITITINVTAAIVYPAIPNDILLINKIGKTDKSVLTWDEATQTARFKSPTAVTSTASQSIAISPNKDEVLGMLGDSITFSGWATTMGISAGVKKTVVCAVSGAVIADLMGQSNNLTADTTIIGIMIGTNNGTVPSTDVDASILKTYTQLSTGTTNSDKLLYLIMNLHKRYPIAKIVLCSPIYRKSTMESGVLASQEDAFLRIANTAGCSYVNARRESGLWYDTDFTTLISDTVHPTPTGLNLMAKNLYRFFFNK